MVADKLYRLSLGIRLYSSSLGIRRATWVAIAGLAVWCIGCEGFNRGFWKGGPWNPSYIFDPHNFDKYGVPTAKFTHFIEALMWSMLEIASVVVGVLLAIEMADWVKRGFAQKSNSQSASDPPRRPI